MVASIINFISVSYGFCCLHCSLLFLDCWQVNLYDLVNKIIALPFPYKFHICITSQVFCALIFCASCLFSRCSKIYSRVTLQPALDCQMTRALPMSCLYLCITVQLDKVMNCLPQVSKLIYWLMTPFHLAVTLKLYHPDFMS